MRGDDPGIVVGLHRSTPDRDLISQAIEHGVCRLDTAYNYAQGASQRLLRQRVGDLLGRLRISTKVGFFPDRGRVEHSLEPARLAMAVRESNTTLGVTPEVVFLHNPERGLAGLHPEVATRRLREACEVLRAAVDAGWCQSWGISTWVPSELLLAAGALRGNGGPVPGALMLRAGLSVPARELVSGEQLVTELGLSRDQLWGMAPFAGAPRAAAWSPATTAPFLLGAPLATPIQAAFRVAFEIPAIGQVAVGVSQAAHLRQLIAAVELRPNAEQISAYRCLLDRRAATVSG